MIWSTTPALENRVITSYCGVVVAEVALAGGSAGASVEVVEGLNLDLTVQTDRFAEAREKALRILEDQARARSADAIIGVRFEYVTFGRNGVLNMVSAYGTAVRIDFTAEDKKEQQLAALREKADFCVVIDGKERGPFSIEQLSRLLSEGRILGEASVRSEETGDIAPLSELLDKKR